MTRNILKSSLEFAYFSIIFQLICRAITFGINAFIVRTIGKEILGIMNVRLLLLESTLLFLSREAILRASLSARTQQKSRCTWPQLVNQMWLTIPICGLLILPCLYIWLNVLSSVDNDLYPQYKFGCYAIAISCIIELTAEMPFFTAQIYCFVKLKIFFDALHIFIRSITFIWIVLSNGQIAIVAFGVAQLISAITIVLSYYIYFYIYIKRLNNHLISSKENGAAAASAAVATSATTTTTAAAAAADDDDDDDNKNDLFRNMNDFPFNKISDMIPGVLPNQEETFNKELQVLTFSFLKQGILKQILTEGEKYVMSVSPVLSFSEQATYDIVNNLGSLAARFIFRPIEDSCYFYFTQTIARDIPLKDQDKSKVSEAANVLKAVCRTVSSIGLMAFIFGQSFSGGVLLLYGGADFVAEGIAEKLLRWHSLAIYLLSINGITEGYMFATNTSLDIDRYNYYMAVFSVLFLILSYILTNILGPIGFILANCTNMFLRICYSTYFISKQYKSINLNPLTGLLPGKYFLISLLVMGGCCKLSQLHFQEESLIKHFAIGTVCVGLCILCWCMENMYLIKTLYRKYSGSLKNHPE